MKILLVSSEIAPYSKTGGLADVAAALPKALQALGHEVSVVSPLYRMVDKDRFGLKNRDEVVSVPIGWRNERARILEGELSSGLPAYFIDHPGYFTAR